MPPGEPPAPPPNPDVSARPPPAASADSLRRQGLMRRVAVRTRAHAEIVFPAAPSLASHFLDILADHFAALGRPFSGPELETLRRHLVAKLREAFDASPTSSVVVRYNTVNDGSLRLDYGVAVALSTLAEQYEYWTQTREPPLFGSAPDAKIVALARDLPAGAACLDVGAGTGRNALALARLGLAVDAVEPAPALAAVLRAEAEKEQLAVTLHETDGTSAPLPLPPGAHRLAFASQVTSHFRSKADLRALLVAFARALSPGGHAALSLFLTRPEYAPDRAARELGQIFWTMFFTPAELAEALDGLPFTTLSDEEALEYERDHRGDAPWPPTGWFEPWSLGEDVFGPQALPPISLRWVVLVRGSGSAPDA